MTSIAAIKESSSRGWAVAVAFVILALVGAIDYLSGFQLFFSVFYLLAVGTAAWFVGKGFGWLLSVLSVVVWLGGDLAAGARYSSPLVPIWNALILLLFYGFVVWLLTRLRSLQRHLEDRVRQRTEDLEKEMGERRRLEEEILQVSEREQRRIGYDLHDGLCQHLTATALAGQVLSEQLASNSRPETSSARNVVEMIEQGISLARSVARGLSPVELDAEGLMAAFEDMADQINQGGRIQCVFEHDTPVLMNDQAVATHLFRIAQEAVSNAIRHGRPRRINVSLTEEHGKVTLAVEDDGLGLPETTEAGRGMGIRTMAYRASLLGGSLAVEPAPTGGTIVTCTMPLRVETGLGANTGTRL